jgi:hypothetical protein
VTTGFRLGGFLASLFLKGKDREKALEISSTVADGVDELAEGGEPQE